MTFLFFLFPLLAGLFLTGLCRLFDLKFENSNHRALVPVLHICTFQTAESHRRRDARIVLKGVIRNGLERVWVSEGCCNRSVGNTESVRMNLWRHRRGKRGRRRLRKLSEWLVHTERTRALPAGRRTRRTQIPSSPGLPYP